MKEETILICSNCGNEQEVGKFCGKCGGALGQESANEIKEPSESSDVEQAQEEIAVSQATGQGTITADANEIGRASCREREKVAGVDVGKNEKKQRGER